VLASDTDVQEGIEISVNDEARMDRSKSGFANKFKRVSSLYQELVVLFHKVMPNPTLRGIRAPLQKLVFQFHRLSFSVAASGGAYQRRRAAYSMMSVLAVLHSGDGTTDSGLNWRFKIFQLFTGQFPQAVLMV
jgi:hypothetical protein